VSIYSPLRLIHNQLEMHGGFPTLSIARNLIRRPAQSTPTQSMMYAQSLQTFDHRHTLNPHSLFP
jgi:hypothetical protein